MGFFPFQPPSGGGGAVSSVFTRTGAVAAANGDYTVSQVTGAAPLASPTFTGTPAGPTAAPGTNTTELATTAYATAAIAAAAAARQIWLVPSGDATGVADAAAINSAVTALASSATGLIVLAPVAPWFIECGQVVINRSGLYLNANGCTITAVGAGTMIDMHDTSNFELRTTHGGGWLSPGPDIQGGSTTGNSTPFHAGDILQLGVFYRAYNFTGGTTSKGLWLDNRTFFTEQCYGRVFTDNCTAGVVLDVSAGNTTNTGSFERCSLQFNTDQGNPAFDGVVLQNGAFVQDGILDLFGNFGTSASPLTSAALRINGSTPGGVAQAADSNITNSVLNIGMECDQVTGSDAPFTINFGTGTNFIGSCSGNIDFGASNPFQSSNNGGQFIGYIGVVAGDPNLPAFLPAGTTNLADSPQTISSLTPAPVTSVTQDVAAFTAYRVRLYIPYSSTHTSGTPVFTFTGPAFALASFNWWYQTAATPFTTVKTIATSAPTMTGPTLTTGANLALIGEGTIAWSAAGTVGIDAATTASAANTFVIPIGAYIEVLPLTDP